ncbi:MAG: ankyrin repeat domain-containing protein [Firmicutes bacterium]|nr:ankyrin repeat domain-containing protein [Bacillota bacterium]
MKKILTAITLIMVFTFNAVWADESHLAAARGDFGELIKISRSTPEQLKAKDSHGWTPLHYATNTDNYWLCKWLTGQGADVNAKENKGRTPLSIAVEKSNLRLVCLLLDLKADTNISDEAGDTPILISACGKDFEIVSVLLKNGADINKKNRKGESPLTSAIRNGNLSMVKYLVDKGADYTSGDASGRTPLYLAYSNDNQPIINYLKSLNASITEQEIHKARYFGCMNNIKNIATALEMYYMDNNKYPDRLDLLVPNYLHFLPTCKESGKNTYSESYRVIENGKDYEFCCKSKNHEQAGVPEDYPKYKGAKGLIMPTAPVSSRPF